MLVTGGAGFLGSALVWALNEHECENIVVADFAPTGLKERNLRPLRFREYVSPEILLGRAVSGHLGSFDCVFHLGACSSTAETDTDYLRRNNYEYTKALAGAAIDAGTRFVYASSAATYGDGSAGMEDSDCERLQQLKPLNPYGESKHAFDVYAWKAGWLDRITGLKYFNIFGPNEAHKGEMRSMVHKSYEQAARTGSVRLFKSYREGIQNGEQQRDFLYVKDALRMTLHLAETGSTGLFNVGSGEAHTWNQLAQAVFSSLRMPVRIEYIEMPPEIRSTYQYFTKANIESLRRRGYADPITPLEDAVYDYVQNYLVPDRTLGQVSPDERAMQ